MTVASGDDDIVWRIAAANTDGTYGHVFVLFFKLTRNFQKFSSDDSNESLQSSSPSLTGFNIQASVTTIVTSESWESPYSNETGRGLSALRNVANLKDLVTVSDAILTVRQTRLEI